LLGRCIWKQAGLDEISSPHSAGSGIIGTERTQ